MSTWEVQVTKGRIFSSKCMKQIQGKLILVRVSVSFELQRVIGSQQYHIQKFQHKKKWLGGSYCPTAIQNSVNLTFFRKDISSVFNIFLSNLLCLQYQPGEKW